MTMGSVSRNKPLIQSSYSSVVTALLLYLILHTLSSLIKQSKDSALCEVKRTNLGAFRLPATPQKKSTASCRHNIKTTSCPSPAEPQPT